MLFGQEVMWLVVLAAWTIREALINSTVSANCCVMRCSKSSHMSEYAAVSALLFLALYSTQRITQNLLRKLGKKTFLPPALKTDFFS